MKNKLMLGIIALSLLSAGIVFADAPTTVTAPVVEQGHHKNKEKHEAWKLVKADREVLRKDRKKIHADTKQYGKESPQVQADRTQMEADRAKIEQDRKVLRAERQKQHSGAPQQVQ